MLTRIIGFIAALLLWSSSAMAADVFTVSGVYVQAEGATAIEAQTTAISEGQLAAANLVVERVTLESERQTKGVPPLDIQTAAKLIRGMEIANEKRSSNEYFGDITVAFNPPAVRDYLAAQGLNMIATQSQMRLVLPVLSGSDLWSENDWSTAWVAPTYLHALTPMQGVQPGQGNNSIIDSARASSGNIDALKAIGRLYGVNQILVADARESFSGVTVSVTDVSLDAGTTRRVGSVTGVNFEDAARRVVAQVESDWKQAAVSSSENAVNMSVTILYRSHSDWQRVQEVINNSSQILDARLDALSKDGALMTITYGGDLSRLTNELSYKGVKLENTPNLGTVLGLTGRY